MVTTYKLFKTSLAKNGTLLKQGAKIFLLPACLLSAVYLAVLSLEKNLAGLKMPLSILLPQEDYLVCWGEGRENPPTHNLTVI